MTPPPSPGKQKSLQVTVRTWLHEIDFTEARELAACAVALVFLFILRLIVGAIYWIQCKITGEPWQH